MTADGRILTASESEHPDLFWATRGGGGNFGVATRFEFKLHPVGPTVLAGMLLYPAAMAAAVLRNFRDVMADAADEIGSGVALITAPTPTRSPSRSADSRSSGRPLLRRAGGAGRAGAAAAARVRAAGDRHGRADAVRRPPEARSTPTIPAGAAQLLDGRLPDGLADEAIETLCRFHRSKPSPGSEIFMLPGGGAAARVPDGTMAIVRARRAVQPAHPSLWEDPADDEANIAWTRELGAAMKPFTTGRVYVNFIGDEGQERVVASFGRDGYRRLQALKDRYDPDNMFRTTQNIKPSV